MKVIINDVVFTYTLEDHNPRLLVLEKLYGKDRSFVLTKSLLEAILERFKPNNYRITCEAFANGFGCWITLYNPEYI
jgi:hypothetical protein